MVRGSSSTPLIKFSRRCFTNITLSVSSILITDGGDPGVGEFIHLPAGGIVQAIVFYGFLHDRRNLVKGSGRGEA